MYLAGISSSNRWIKQAMRRGRRRRRSEDSERRSRSQTTHGHRGGKRATASQGLVPDPVQNCGTARSQPGLSGATIIERVAPPGTRRPPRPQRGRVGKAQVDVSWAVWTNPLKFQAGRALRLPRRGHGPSRARQTARTPTSSSRHTLGQITPQAGGPAQLSRYSTANPSRQQAIVPCGTPTLSVSEFSPFCHPSLTVSSFSPAAFETAFKTRFYKPNLITTDFWL